MDALIIDGPARLSGEVEISGSKNTALPLLFASILFEDEIKFENVPRLWDIETTLEILQTMGAKSQWNKETGEISIHSTITHKVAPYELVKKMRAGILALGPLVARFGEAKVSLPGGCAIGARPVNFHIDAMRQMGVQIDVEEGYINAHLKGRAKGAKIHFPQVTVTGTENLLILAACAEGRTVLENSANEPEVVALGEMLQICGAKIQGLGTPTITIEGTKLHAPHRAVRIPPDRIETGTWISIAAATRSPLTLKHCDPATLGSVIEVFKKMGVGIETLDASTLRVTPAEKYFPIDLETAPYPGFPTDMQAQILALTCLASGTSHIRENIFENRFMHVAELRRLGAKIAVEGNLATIEGPVELQGAPIMATDLRASASLVVAALSSRGQTKISRIYHLDRGYQRLDEKLRRLGARITRIVEK